MTLYAYVQADKGGRDRVLTGFVKGRYVKGPLTFTDRGEAEICRLMARAMARATDRPVRLIQFDITTTLETFSP
jgi:hypothetical protein